MLHRVPSWLVPASALVLAGFVLPRSPSPGTGAGAPSSTASAQKKLAEAAPTPPELPIRIGEIALDEASGRYVAPLGNGRARLTLDPRLQERLEGALDTYRVPWGATVLIEPATGRILALAEHSRAEPGRRGLPLAALAPAASIFKLVTAAALLEQGIQPDEEVCYHGGKRRLAPRLLADDPRRDHRCTTLVSAFGHSTNVVFAKLAGRGLDADRLRATAERFLFNTEIPFAHPVEVSRAVIPEDDFGLAETAAGFGPVKLSPLHAALLAAIVANDGVLVPPVIIDGVEGGDLPPSGDPRRVIDETVAAELARMMRSTVTEGTARRAFARARGPLRGIPVAGKTGSLANAEPYRDYSWFVGYAPADRPQVAIATVVVNERLWHARAPTVAREALEAYFATRVASARGGELRTAAAR
jgi:cell division protein FtsI/penicillin-binding protein 2